MTRAPVNALCCRRKLSAVVRNPPNDRSMSLAKASPATNDDGVTGSEGRSG